METIKYKQTILAIIYRDKDWAKGLNFITPNKTFIQAGSWYYPKGKKLAAHVHKKYERLVDRTHEVVFIKQGSMRILLYDEDRNFQCDVVLNKGDLAVLINGGHGYEILEDDTQVLETKNGPFINVDKDKEKF